MRKFSSYNGAHKQKNKADLIFSVVKRNFHLIQVKHCKISVTSPRLIQPRTGFWVGLQTGRALISEGVYKRYKKTFRNESMRNTLETDIQPSEDVIHLF